MLESSTPPPQHAIVPGPDEDRGARLVVTHIVGCVISMIFVALRFWSRFIVNAIGADDWVMLVTALLYIPLTVLTSIFSLNGGTRHLYYLQQDPPTIVYVSKLNWTAQTFGIWCTTLGKVAIGITILRVLDRVSRWRRWSLYVAMGVNVITGASMTIINYTQCKNVEAIWDPVVRARTECWDPRVQSTFVTCGASINTFMDFYFALLPIPVVWDLKLSRPQKIGLGLLLGCGVVTGVISALKTSQLGSLSERSDLTWETFQLYVWNAVEVTLIIVLGSLPHLRGLFQKVMSRRTSSGRSTKELEDYKLSALSRNTKGYRNVDSETGHTRVSASVPHASGRGVVQGQLKVGEVHVTQTFETSWSVCDPDAERGRL